MAHTTETLYISEADLLALLPQAFISEALDDDGDGTADGAVVNALLITACNTVDSYLESRFNVPADLAKIPATVITGAVHFAIDLCYARRGLAEKNPYKAQLKEIREILTRVREGKEEIDLVPRGDADFEPIQIITEKAVAVGTGNSF